MTEADAERWYLEMLAALDTASSTVGAITRVLRGEGDEGDRQVAESVREGITESAPGRGMH